MLKTNLQRQRRLSLKKRVRTFEPERLPNTEATKSKRSERKQIKKKE